MLVVPNVSRTGIQGKLMPGDQLAGGKNILTGSLTTVGAGTWTGAAIATGIIRRTGPVGGYTDTTDTAVNILTALAGNADFAEVVAGMTFDLTFINTVAQAMTFAAGAGVVAGTGTLNCAASLVRDYILTVLNTTKVQAIQANTTNASAVVTFVLPAGMTALPMYGAGAAIISVGATVSGTGITAGTTVIGVTQGVGGITGVTLSANATATSPTGGASLTFGPTIQIDSVRSATL
jgi:hypothetical protein